MKLLQRLYYFRRPTRWTSGIGSLLPLEYKKFWREWKKQPAAVHYIKRQGTYVRNKHGEVYVMSYYYTTSMK